MFVNILHTFAQIILNTYPYYIIFQSSRDWMFPQLLQFTYCMKMVPATLGWWIGIWMGLVLSPPRRYIITGLEICWAHRPSRFLCHMWEVPAIIVSGFWPTIPIIRKKHQETHGISWRFPIFPPYFPHPTCENTKPKAWCPASSFHPSRQPVTRQRWTHLESFDFFRWYILDTHT